MQANKTKILSTRALDQSLPPDFEMETISFIGTKPIKGSALKNEINSLAKKPGSAVFTSIQAVNIVGGFLGKQKPGWTIYCIEGATKTAVEARFGKESIAATAASASTLAKKIISDHKTKNLIFFCGNQRRNELPIELRKHGMEVKEIMVYQTLATPVKIKKHYHGILFFSPSGVSSFFSLNRIPHSTVLFAIGATTANEIKENVPNIIVTSDRPDPAALIDKLISFFETHSSPIDHP